MEAVVDERVARRLEVQAEIAVGRMVRVERVAAPERGPPPPPPRPDIRVEVEQDVGGDP